MIQLVAVLAAVFGALPIHQSEHLAQVGLAGGDAAGILASNHVLHLFWQHQVNFLYNLLVLHHVYGDVRVDEAQHGIIYVDDVVYLDDVLLAQLPGRHVHNQGNPKVRLVQSQPRENAGAAARPNVVYHQTVLDGVYAEH